METEEGGEDELNGKVVVLMSEKAQLTAVGIDLTTLCQEGRDLIYDGVGNRDVFPIGAIAAHAVECDKCRSGLVQFLRTTFDICLPMLPRPARIDLKGVRRALTE